MKMKTLAFAAVTAMASAGSAQATTTIGFQSLYNQSLAPVTYTESGYTIQSNNTREPVSGFIQNATLTINKSVGSDSGYPSVNLLRSTSFSLTGGTFTFDGLAAYFTSKDSATNSFTVVGSLLDQQLYSMEFTATGGTAQKIGVFRSFTSGSSMVFDKLVFTSGASGGSIALDDIKVTAAAVPTAELVVPPVTSAVPEPATWAMLLVGFGIIGAASRYRRRSTKVALA